MKLSTRFMAETEVLLRWNKYIETPHWPSLVIHDAFGAPLMKASVNPEFANGMRETDYLSYCDGDYIWIKDWSENEGILDALIKAKILAPTPYEVYMGDVCAVLCRILRRETPESIDEVDSPAGAATQNDDGDANVITPVESDPPQTGWPESSLTPVADAVIEFGDGIPHTTRVAAPDESLAHLYAVQDAVTLVQKRLNTIIDKEERRFIAGSTIEADL